jgi:bifunctional non-homologous end joining protein LigD
VEPQAHRRAPAENRPDIASDAVRPGRRSVELTHLDRLWWPDEGIRKGDVVDYYRCGARTAVPHLRGRPFTIKQHYTGPRSPFRWIKDAPPELPAWIPTTAQPARSRGGAPVHYVLVGDELALLWMVEYGCVDLHVWPSRVDRPEAPDFVLFDLDPAGAGFGDVARAARCLRDALELLGLKCCAMTTGGDGMHVRVPLARRHTHEETRRFAGLVALALHRAEPGLVTIERSPARRRGVFVDVKMNGHGQQIVAPYSVRPATARVATPVRWEEVGPALDPGRFTLDEVRRRVEADGDLFAPVLRGRQRLSDALRRIRI